MKGYFWPKKPMGKWSTVLGLVFIVVALLKFSFIKIRVPVPVPTPGVALIGIAAFIVSVISLVKDKERSILLILPVLVGLVIILWTIGEIAYPH